VKNFLLEGEPLLRKACYTDGMMEWIYWKYALRVIDAVL
jgi:hypothetical protein